MEVNGKWVEVSPEVVWISTSCGLPVLVSLPSVLCYKAGPRSFWSRGGSCSGPPEAVLIILCSASGPFPVSAFCFVLGVRFNCRPQNANIW